jgi:hypothetical protein
MRSISLVIFSLLFAGSANAQNQLFPIVTLKGQMPNIVKDRIGMLHLTYGIGDSLLYVSSKDGKVFTKPSLIAVVPNVFTTAMRGPQVAATSNGLVVIACTKKGDVLFFRKSGSVWTKGVRLNEKSETAKEALIALSADGLNVYAIWLSIKEPKGQNLYGVRSQDGGKTWGKNSIVYESPDNTICECCKPSVVMKSNQVYVMFRNWLQGNRDMYLIHSIDKGQTFGTSQKLGTGNWKLDGCPMDGGGIVINTKGLAETIWQRQGKIYTSLLGMPETQIGEGRNGSIENSRNNTIYAWGDKGNIIVKKNSGQNITIGKGSQPLLKAVDDISVLCIWQTGDNIQMRMLTL